MRRFAMLFSGQGFQRHPMLEDFLNAKGRCERKLVDDLVSSTSVSLNYSIRDLLAANTVTVPRTDSVPRKYTMMLSAEILKDTKYAQPALFLADILPFFLLKKKLPSIEPYLEDALYAGHSLGQYAALVAAGALNVFAGAEIVDKRAALMSEASRDSSLVAIISKNPINESSLRISLANTGVDIALINTPNMYVVGGYNYNLLHNRTILSSYGKLVSIPVSGAFHTYKMKTAAQDLESHLLKARFENPKGHVLSNNDPSICIDTKDKFVDESLKQMTNTVRWYDTMRQIDQSCVDLILIFGYGTTKKNPNHVLKAYAQAACKGKHEIIILDSVQTVYSAVNRLNELRI